MLLFLRNRNILGHWDTFFFLHDKYWLCVNHNQSQRQSYNMHWTIEHLYRNNSIESQQVKIIIIILFFYKTDSLGTYKQHCIRAG